jgi:flagellar biosynthesis protein FliR
MSLVFIYTLKIATLPLIVLACGIWGVACTVRVVPEMNLLATGLPMRILLAYGMLILSLSSMLAIFQEGFQEIIQLVNITLRN